MKLVGFNFNKISVEKLSDKVKDIKINTNIDISEINSPKSDILKTKEEILAVKFAFNLDYEPDFAKLRLEGVTLLAVEPKIAKEVIKQWKDKKIPEDFRLSLYNLILRKSSLKALQLEDEMNLPLHMPMPALGPAPKKE